MENYAAGAYTVLLALWFLGSHTWEPISWCTASDLSDDLEVDFAALRAAEHHHFEAPVRQLILGEAKSYGGFERRDFARLRTLRSRFPDEVIAVATLRDELDADERQELRVLAQPEVTRAGDVLKHPRVLVLTAMELLQGAEPPRCWEEAGGKAAKLAQALGRARPTLPVWCDITAQLHLDLPGHAAWAQQEIERLSKATGKRHADGRASS